MTQIKAFELRNNNGAKASVINYGARLTALIIPTQKYGNINTILAYEHNEQYKLDPMFHGAIAGPVCNRIADGKYHVGQQLFQTEKNEGNNTLHSGSQGLHQKYWRLVEHDNNSITLEVTLFCSESGFPGNISISLTYTLLDSNSLQIKWSAISDKITPLSLTNHSYFNLAGFGDIKSHLLHIPAKLYTPINEEQIPTGEIAKVENSIFDLRKFTTVSSILDSNEPEIIRWGGLDHNWLYEYSQKPTLQAQLYSPDSHLLLQIESTLPGLQCYTGNQLAVFGIHGTHEGICLEPQFPPNAVNQHNFPSCLLPKNKRVMQQINFNFSEISTEQFNQIKDQ